jgi:hypothetical protein
LDICLIALNDRKILMNFIIAFVAAVLSFVTTPAANAQSSWARIFWATSHDGWTQEAENAWFFSDVRESSSVAADIDRVYFLTWPGGATALSSTLTAGYYVFADSLSTQSHLLSAWDVSRPYSFVVDDEIQGTSPSLSAPDFPQQLPRLADPNALRTITPGDLIEVEVLPWTALSSNSRTTWIRCVRVDNGETVWAPSSGGANGMVRQFDTSTLVPGTAYCLDVTYSSRFRDAFAGSLLGNTNRELGFDRVTYYRFETLGPPCVADMTGDGRLDFFDVATFIVYFQVRDPLADLTGDGRFDFFDVTAFLNLFFQGCV